MKAGDLFICTVDVAHRGSGTVTPNDKNLVLSWDHLRLDEHTPNCYLII